MKFRNALVCEDIRIENNGKHILIGVFSSDIRVVGVAPTISLAFWIIVEDFPRGEEAELKFQISMGAKKLLQGTMTLTWPTDNSRGALVLPPVPIQVGEGGTLRLEIKAGDAKGWKKLLTTPVIVTAENPTAPPPPSEQSPSAPPA